MRKPWNTPGDVPFFVNTQLDGTWNTSWTVSLDRFNRPSWDPKRIRRPGVRPWSHQISQQPWNKMWVFVGFFGVYILFISYSMFGCLDDGLDVKKYEVIAVYHVIIERLRFGCLDDFSGWFHDGSGQKYSLDFLWYGHWTWPMYIWFFVGWWFSSSLCERLPDGKSRYIPIISPLFDGWYCCWLVQQYLTP